MATSQKHKVPFLLRMQDDESQEADYFGDHSSDLVRIVLFFSILTAGTGFWACFQCIDPFVIEGKLSVYKYPGKLMLFTGGLLISTSVVSIAEAGTLTRVAAICVIRALGCALLVETIAGSTAIALTSSVSAGFFNKSFLENVKGSYSTDRLVTWTTNGIQKKFHCCGVEGPKDWINSTWSQINRDTRMHYPASCCRGDFHCDAKTVNDKGCGFDASEALYNRLKWTYICAFSSIFIHITSLLILSFLERKV